VAIPKQGAYVAGRCIANAEVVRIQRHADLRVHVPVVRGPSSPANIELNEKGVRAPGEVRRADLGKVDIGDRDRSALRRMAGRPESPRAAAVPLSGMRALRF
jgi:hypothetical protein